jgi:hypothetical protein
MGNDATAQTVQHCCYMRTMILNNVRQHNCFVIQGSYIGYMFRLIDQSSSGLFSRLSHKVLCTHWDPSVYTSVKYIKSDQLPNEV